MSQYSLPAQMVGPGGVPVSVRIRPVASSAAAAAAGAASSSSSFALRPSPVVTALAHAARAAENAAASVKNASTYIPTIEMLTAPVLDPLSVVNSAAIAGINAPRFRPIPYEDVMICNADKVRALIHPQEFPCFIPSKAPINLKLLGILEPEGLGKNDKTSGQDIILYRWVSDEIRRLESADGAAAAAAADREKDCTLSGEKQQFLELKPQPASQVFPISVSLHIKQREKTQLVSRLQADNHRNSVWPRVIEYYQPFHPHGNNAFTHYEVKVLMASHDRYFNVGLFGKCANGLSLLLLSLGKASKTNKAQRKNAAAAAASSSSAAALSDEPSGEEKLKNVLYHYITMICLQYWTLVHGRWLELDPVASKNATRYLPEYMFIFHHTTDWTQSFKDAKRDRKGDEKKPKKKSKDKPVNEEAPAAEAVPISDVQTLREAAKGVAFIPFLEAVFEYVMERMTELEDSEYEDIAAVCKKLALSRRAVHKHCTSISTNHTQYFTCSRMKMHIVSGLVDMINDGVHSDTNAQSLGLLETKWFARNKDQLKMNIPKASNEAATAGPNRYNNPYFWSHLTFLPTQGIVVHEATLKRCERSESNPTHQACALRRLLFLANNADSATIMSAILRVGACAFEFANTPETVTLTPKEFIGQFVHAKKFTSMAVLHAQRVDQRMYLPAVAKPSALRYCLQVDDEIARAYVPSLCRDLASFPVSDEQDILSMSRSYFIACSSSRPIVSGIVDLLERKILLRNPSRLCTRFASSQSTLAFPVLGELGGLSHYLTKLFPTDPLCDLVFIDGMLKLSPDERKQLQLIAKSHGVFHGLHMWKLLLKITTSDAEAIASYLFLAHQSEQRRVKSEPQVVKMEDDAASAPAAAAVVSNEFDADWVFARFADLQAEWERAKQASLCQFRRVWGSTVPSPPSNKRKSQEQDADEDYVPNPHWPAQESFIVQLRQSWDHCDRPIVTAHDLSKLIGDMMAVDLEKFQIKMFAVGSQIGIPLDQQRLKVLLINAVISQLGSAASTPVHSLISIVDDDELVKENLKQHQLFFTGSDASVLGKKFSEFFPLGESNRRYATQSCNIEVAFFLWYYSTAVIRPFADNLPRLFPVSSVIKQKQKSNASSQTWVQALVPSDGTPHLTSLMFKFSAEMCKPDIFRELETCIERDTKTSDQAQAMLRAMHTLIKAQGSTDKAGSQNSKLHRVNEFAEQLIQESAPPKVATRAFAPPLAVAAAAAAAPAARFGITKLQALEEQSIGMIIQKLKLLPGIPPSTMIKLHEDLSALIDVTHDPIDFIVRILNKVKGILASHSSLEYVLKRFSECLKSWAIDPSPLQRACAAKFNA
jgi:hypothetical protein